MSILDENIGRDTAGNSELQVTGSLKDSWTSISKWAKFFAILGFVQIALSVLMMGTMREVWESVMMLGRADEAAMSIFLVLMKYLTAFTVVGGIVMFFIHFFHFRFANDIQKALREDDQNSFEKSWTNLRNHFRIFGYTIIAAIVLYFGLMFYVMTSLIPTMQQQLGE